MNKQQLAARIWESANQMRSKIEANEYKDYILGFIYEYLIGMFAANAGKKAGEFYTPHEVSVLMSEMIAHHLKDQKIIEICDSTSGSGSLLLNIGQSIARHVGSTNKIKYYAQELKENTYNLTRMNLVMRGIIPENIFTRNADTRFLKYAFSQINMEFFLVGGGRSKLNAETMMSLILCVLNPIEEQQKIGHYFRTLDDLISRQALQLQKLKQLKSACLEKIFV